MKYIIMADGKGTRWNNYLDRPKHFVEIEGEKLIERTIKRLHMYDEQAEVIITSHNPEYDLDGATRYEPLHNDMEIERFTEELLEDNICFLYGDTFYSDDCIKAIIEKEFGPLSFFGNSKSIVAIKVKDGELFKEHKHKVRSAFEEGKVEACKGWQVYQSYEGLPMGTVKTIAGDFLNIEELAYDINSPEDYKKAVEK
ncbi:MAG: 2-C-methyl-D-erythritol 4-phosphate cytidylyltransferase [Clostridia bacterium]|nr:2-C-methyl-D-erythritol 4-phosphate cytidylyltransferase [Clostridia bacterium]